MKNNKIKHSIALILIFIMIFTFIKIPENNVYGNGSLVTYNGQTGTANYSISTTAQLDLLAQKVNNGTNYKDSTFILTNNIVYTNSNVRNNYTPIGKVQDLYGRNGNSFQGSFDGNGFFISGINLYRDARVPNYLDTYYIGIFGFAYNATIKNLSLVDSIIEIRGYDGDIATTSYTAGGICGFAMGDYGIGTTIENCNNSAVIESTMGRTGLIGGIVGFASSVTTIKNCTNTGSVLGNQAGGIVGEIWGSNIYYCNNNGNMIAGAGIAYKCGGYSNIYGCVNNADIIGNGNTPTWGANGIVYQLSESIITYCANLGDINVNGNSSGLVGFAFGEYNTAILYSYNSGDIYNNNGSSSGLVYQSYSTYNNHIIKGCYTVGKIINPSEYSYGLYAEKRDVPPYIENSYFLNSIGVTKASPYDSDYARSKSSEYMKSQEFVDLLNSTSGQANFPFIKSTTKNKGYPIFWFQKTVENITINGSDSITKGDTSVYTAIVTPNDAINKKLIWSINNEQIADLIQVGTDGMAVIVQGKIKGTVTLTAKAQDGSGVIANKTINIVNNFIKGKANYILIDDVIEYKTGYSDAENDPKYKEEYFYLHNPYQFKDGIKVDNTMGVVEYNNKWQDRVYSHFSKVGTYTIRYRVQDNPPTANILNFENYRYHSDYAENTIYVHRKPIATYSINNDFVTDSSYDLDHSISYANKGIAKWDWTCVSNNGIVAKYTVTDLLGGVNNVNAWVNVYKTLGYKIILKVQDIEGAWSEPCIKSTGEYSKPIADFTIEKNPMFFPNDTQTITDMSYDTNGLALTYSWIISKDGTNILNSTNTNISNDLNTKIISLYPNITGMYYISLKVKNSVGVESTVVTKSFNVIVKNDEPIVNFNLVSNENPTWIFPKTLGLYTLRYRPSNTLFSEEYARFDTYINDPNTDNTGFIYNWKLERFSVKDISNISGVATNTYNYTTQYPFTNSFKNQGLGWGAYRITFSVTDRPPVPPYQSTDVKTTTVTKSYYIIPELSLAGSFESAKPEIMVGDTIKLQSKTNKVTENVTCNFVGTNFVLNKVSEDNNFAYWEKNVLVPDSITESGTYHLQFVANTTYGGNGNITREVKDNVPINIVALKLLNFRITDIVNHPYVSFPYTKDMLISQLIEYKAGYYVTFRIDSKGKPDNVWGRIDVGNNGSLDQIINMSKVTSGDTETWRGKFYTSAYLPTNTIISIKLDCKKGVSTYDYNLIENWDGQSLITNGSALMDGRVNLTN